jgi:DNA-binding transcriptional MerR regulator
MLLLSKLNVVVCLQREFQLNLIRASLNSEESRHPMSKSTLQNGEQKQQQQQQQQQQSIHTLNRNRHWPNVCGISVRA